ncbi:MAG: radical SAM protein, partial [Microbacterium sp.]
RFTSPHPAEFTDDVIEAMADTPTVMPQLHMPLQSGSDRILRAMRRSYRSDKFLGILDRVRAAMPDAAITTDIIVGFPGETEEDFATLCDFVTDARLDAIGVFGYSDEDGTEAETYDGKLDEDEIAERVEHLSALADELTAQRAEERIGEEVVVLVETLDPDADGPGSGTAEGRAACQGPEVDGSTLLTGLTDGVRVGDMIRARVVATDGVDLVAEPF